VTTKYVPKKGDFVILTFDPQAGHERQGRQPALVVSNDLFNLRTGLCIACPITSTERGFPFHVAIPDGGAVGGFVMAEQVKSLDFQSRKAKRVGKAPIEVLEETLSILAACLY
jgi:mRNA interferase MazF